MTNDHRNVYQLIEEFSTDEAADSLGEEVRGLGKRIDHIPRDILGNPVTSGEIAGFQGNKVYSHNGVKQNPHRWFFSSMCNDDKCEADDLAELVATVRARGYVIKDTYDEKHPPVPGYNHVLIRCIHPAGIKEAERLERESEQVLIGAKPIYVRFGKPPSSGISHDYRDDRDLKGISCYYALRLRDGRTILKLSRTQMAIHHISKFSGRQAYEVTGNEIGKGPDDEPLLADVKIVKKVKISE
jgi:hypothetical protein